MVCLELTEAEKLKVKFYIEEHGIRSPNGCLIVSKGCGPTHKYPQLWIRKQKIRLLRLSYATFVNPIPEGKGVRHKCDDPQCVEFIHLTLGTQADNVKDRVSRGRNAKSRQGARLFSEDEILDIRISHRTGETMLSIAQRYEVNSGTIYNIVNRKTYKDI